VNVKEEDREDEVSAAEADSIKCTSHSSTRHSSCNDHLPVDCYRHQSVCTRSNRHRTKHHMSTRTRRQQRPLMCNVCKQKFSQRRSLELHVKNTHSAEQRFLCSVCKRRFMRSGSLKRHMSSHSRAKPYSCYECGKTFSSSYGLAVHVRSHTGDKPFSCSICHHRFTQSGSLRTHMLRHSGEKPHSCDVCGGKFVTAFSLKRHNLRAHAGDVSESRLSSLRSVKQQTSISLRYRLGPDMKLQIQNWELLPQSQH